MPADPPTRDDIAVWWEGVIDGRVHREAAHEWAEPLMFAEYDGRPDPMVMTALQYLHGFDLTFMPPDQNVLRHGPDGTYLRTVAEIADEFELWQRRCAEYDLDPEAYMSRAREQARNARSSRGTDT